MLIRAFVIGILAAIALVQTAQAQYLPGPSDAGSAPGQQHAHENCGAVVVRQGERDITRQAVDTQIYIPVANCQHIWQAIGQIGNQVDHPNHP